MSFDLNKTLEEMVGAATGVLSKDATKIQACVRRAVDESRAELEIIAQNRLSGAYDDDDVESELEDEGKTLRSALLACKVQGKAAVQKAVNAAFGVLKKAIKAAL